MPFQQNNTSRLWVRYTVGQYEHEILFRNAVGGSPTPLIATAQTLCAYLADMMHNDDDFVSARYSDIGTGFSVAVPWAVVAGAGGLGLSPGDPESHYLDFIGRDTTFGARVRWSFFSRALTCPTPATNRVQPGQNGIVDAAVAAFQAAANDPAASARICAVSKGQPIVYPYVNSGWNSYWQRQQRA